jgi:large subunit ribosomal protein L9
MRIILKQDDENLGDAGQIISVKDGFARNYLIPRGVAYEATNANLKRFEEEKKHLLLKSEKEKKQSEMLAEKLEKVSCTISVAVGEEDKLFGSVTSQDIADALQEKGIELDKRKIQLEEPIKSLGIYTIPARLHPEVNANVKVWVVKK